MNMFKCFVCQAVHATSQCLITHLRICHSFYPSTRFKLVCAQDHCRRQFSTFSGFKKHLISVHDKDCQSGDAETSESFQADFHSLQNGTEVAGTSVVQSPDTGYFDNNGSGQSIKENTEDICATIIAKLHGSGMANSVVSSIVSDLEEFAGGLHSQVKHEILSAVPKDNPVRSTLEKGFDNLENPFVSFNTETKRMKYFNKKWGIVEPLEKKFRSLIQDKIKIQVLMIRSQ